MHSMSTKFGVDSSSRFSFRARTYTNRHTVTDGTGHFTHASVTAGVVIASAIQTMQYYRDIATTDHSQESRVGDDLDLL